MLFSIFAAEMFYNIFRLSYNYDVHAAYLY